MEKYLRKCLNSLIVSEDELELLEVLVINDGSKDSSSQIAHEYETRFPKTFKVVDKENGNYGSCINRGLKEATGKYVKVLDADDYYDTAVLEKYVKELNEIDADLIITDFTKVDEEYKSVSTITYSNSFDENVDYSLQQMTDKMRAQLQMHAVTYKTENLLKINYKQTEGISYTDQELVFYPFEAVWKIRYCKKNVYQYLVGREGQTMDKNIRSKSFGAEIIIFKRMLEYYNKNDANSNQYGYLTKFIQDRVKHIYECVLFEGIDFDLAEFDDYLKNHCNYTWVDHISSYRFKYKLVKEFRKHRNVDALKRSLKYRLLMVYVELRSSSNRIQ